MADVPMVANLRELMEVADRRPDASAEAWNARRDAEHVLRAWRIWLPGLLALIEQRPQRDDEDCTSNDEYYLKSLVQESTLIRCGSKYFHCGRAAIVAAAVCVADASRTAGLVRAGRGLGEGDNRSSTYRPADIPQHPAPTSRCVGAAMREMPS